MTAVEPPTNRPVSDEPQVRDDPESAVIEKVDPADRAIGMLSEGVLRDAEARRRVAEDETGDEEFDPSEPCPVLDRLHPDPDAPPVAMDAVDGDLQPMDVDVVDDIGLPPLADSGFDFESRINESSQRLLGYLHGCLAVATMTEVPMCLGALGSTAKLHRVLLGAVRGMDFGDEGSFGRPAPFLGALDGLGEFTLPEGVSRPEVPKLPEPAEWVDFDAAAYVLALVEELIGVLLKDIPDATETELQRLLVSMASVSQVGGLLIRSVRGETVEVPSPSRVRLLGGAGGSSLGLDDDDGFTPAGAIPGLADGETFGASMFRELMAGMKSAMAVTQAPNLVDAIHRARKLGMKDLATGLENLLRDGLGLDEVEDGDLPVVLDGGTGRPIGTASHLDDMKVIDAAVREAVSGSHLPEGHWWHTTYDNDRTALWRDLLDADGLAVARVTEPNLDPSVREWPWEVFTPAGSVIGKIEGVADSRDAAESALLAALARERGRPGVVGDPPLLPTFGETTIPGVYDEADNRLRSPEDSD